MGNLGTCMSEWKTGEAFESHTFEEGWYKQVGKNRRNSLCNARSSDAPRKACGIQGMSDLQYKKRFGKSSEILK